MSFWVSIAVLSLVQATIVALPRQWDPGPLARLRSGLWGLVAPASIVAFVAVVSVVQAASASALTYLALVAVPPLAALALGWLARGARPACAWLAVPLFALAWADRGGTAGQGAAVALSALSCVALGALIAAVTPARWLALGIVAMALVDAALVGSDLLRQPNDALNAARPAVGLPRLQSAPLGGAVIGYGDLFVAGLLGGLLAFTPSRGGQLRGAVAVALLALAFDLLFLLVSELPATVPVAAALLLTPARPAPRRSARWRHARSPRLAADR